jgi:hypothetical protein
MKIAEGIELDPGQFREQAGVAERFSRLNESTLKQKAEKLAKALVPYLSRTGLPLKPKVTKTREGADVDLWFTKEKWKYPVFKVMLWHDTINDDISRLVGYDSGRVGRYYTISGSKDRRVLGFGAGPTGASPKDYGMGSIAREIAPDIIDSIKSVEW